MKKTFLIIAPIFAFLAFSPFQCQNISREGGLFKSTDMGETWQKIIVEDEDKSFSIKSLDILDIEVSPDNSDIVYLGSQGNGFFKSYSNGSFWHKVEDENDVLSSRANVYDIVIDPKDPEKIYIGAYQDKKGRVFRSQDAGESWEEVYVVSREKFAVFAVAVDRYDPSIIYMGTAQGGFLKSTDYGKSWEIIKWFDDVISDIVINPQDTRTVYVATFKKGIYKTNDKGNTWQSFEEALKEFRQAKKVEKLVIDPKRPNILYAGSEYGLLTSKDGGESWQEVDIIMPSQSEPVLSLAVENQNSDHLYYGAGSILYRSLDQGNSWTVHEIESSQSIKVITIDHKDPGTIYLGMYDE